MMNEGRACQHLGCEIFCNLKSCKPAPPLSPGKGEEKTCPFWAAPRNSANVGGRSCARPKLVVTVSRRTLCVHAHSRLRGQSFKMEIWSDGQRARLPDGPTGRIMGRPSGLLPSSPPALACVHLSGQASIGAFLFVLMFSVCFLFRIRVTSSLNIILFP